MSSTDHYSFSAEKIFLWLFILTAVEVGWGYVGHALEWGKLLLWGGLVMWALIKGFLIAAYFMHFKFEGWIIKGLVAPTPFLVLVILFAVSPDISRNERLDNPIGAMYVENRGAVHEYMLHTSERPAVPHSVEEIPVEREPGSAAPATSGAPADHAPTH